MTWRQAKEAVSTLTVRLVLMSVVSLVFLIVLCLFMKSWPFLAARSISEILFASSWHPLKGEFGFFPFVVSTLAVTAIAMVLSIPVCLMSALYLSEYARRRFREFARMVIDILAGIPSVIYGLWGVMAVVPVARYLGEIQGHLTTGYSLLAGGVVLAIMVSPVILSVMTDVFQMIPWEVRESSLSLGTTRWETIKHVILRQSMQGMMAAVMLGFSRALGETMAVMMVVGNVMEIPRSIFDPAYPLPALIANNYGEMMSIPLYDSALLFSALLLLLVVGGFSLAAQVTLIRLERRVKN